MNDKMIEQIKADRDAGTPGPWEFRDPMHHDDPDPNEIIGPSEGASRYGEKGVWCVCEFDEDDISDGDPLTVANARRIARVPDMEARILSDAEVIKAAEELAKVLDNVTGKTWAATVDMEDACKVDTALATFRQAQRSRAALEEKNDDE